MTRIRYLGVLLVAFVLLLAVVSPGAAQGDGMRVLGQLGGSIGAVCVDGSRAYVGVGPSLVLLDLSDPFQPMVLGETGRLADLIEGIAVHGNYAFLACRFDGLHVIDVSDAANPHQVAQLPGVSFSRDLTLREDPQSGQVLAYVAEYDWLRIIDVTSPLSPTLVSEVQEGASSYDISILAKNDRVYAYLAAQAGLRVFDATDAAHPTVIQTLLPGTWTKGVAVTQDQLFAAGNTGVWAFDLTDPAAPVETNYIEMVNGAEDVLLVDGRLYIATYNWGLMAVDVDDKPWSLLGPWNIGSRGEAMELDLAQDVADSPLLVSLGHSLIAVDIAGPNEPQARGSYHGLEAWDVDTLPGYAYVASDGLGMQIVDVSDPGALEVVGIYTGTQQALQVVAEERQGRRYAFLTGLTEGLHIVEVTDPAAPVFVAHVPAATETYDVAVQGNYAYLADFDGLAIVDVTDLAQPVEVGRFATQSRPASAVAVFQETGGQGRLLGCVSDWGRNFYVLDLTDPAQPVQLAVRQTSWRARSIVVQRSVAYLALGPGGVTEWDLSNPARPRDGACSTFPSAYVVYDLALQGRYLYTAGTMGTQVFDLTQGCYANSLARVPAAEMEGVHGLQVVGDTLYVADPYGGLGVLEYAIARWTPHFPLLLK